VKTNTLSCVFRSVQSFNDDFRIPQEAIFFAAGAFLSVGYADGTFLNLFDPTTPLLAVFWGIISVGIASMAVAVLDHISLQYDIPTKG